MPDNFLLLLSTWGVLGLIVLSLAIYRASLGRKEDDNIHLMDGESSMINVQAQVAHRLDVVERWGKSLTVVLALYALGIAAYYLYAVWIASTTTAQMG